MAWRVMCGYGIAMPVELSAEKNETELRGGPGSASYQPHATQPDALFGDGQRSRSARVALERRLNGERDVELEVSEKGRDSFKRGRGRVGELGELCVCKYARRG